MSQDLLYSILPRAVNNPISKGKTGIKKIDKTPKTGTVDEEHTTLPDESLAHSINPSIDVDKEKPAKKNGGLDTYA